MNASAQQIVEFFDRNPDEELLAIDVPVKFGGSLKNACDLLADLLQSGLVKARKETSPGGDSYDVYQPRSAT